jgi:hypothetical protein
VHLPKTTRLMHQSEHDVCCALYVLYNHDDGDDDFDDIEIRGEKETANWSCESRFWRVAKNTRIGLKLLP